MFCLTYVYGAFFTPWVNGSQQLPYQGYLGESETFAVKVSKISPQGQPNISEVVTEERNSQWQVARLARARRPTEREATLFMLLSSRRSDNLEILLEKIRENLTLD